MKKNQSGQSLVSVIVAAGVGAIVLGFLADAMIQQGVGQKFLTQKLEINDLTNNLITTFSNANNCSCQFADDSATNPNHANFATNLKFDTTLPQAQRKISVKKLYTGCKSATFTPPVFVEDNAFVPNSVSNLKVDTVELVNLHQVGVNPNEWQGQWQISFQTGSGKVIRSVKPINVTQKVTINTTTPNSTTAAVISACTGISTGNGTRDYLAKWTDTLGLLQNSAVFESFGNVGIGTATPATALHIKGQADKRVLRIESNEGLDLSNSPNIQLNRSRGTPAAPLNILNSDYLGVLTFRGYGTTNFGWYSASIRAVAEEDFTDAAMGTALAFSTTPVGSSGIGSNFERVRITSTGNVGIGTNVPTNTLHIYSNSAGDYPTLKLESGPLASWPVYQMVDRRVNGGNWNIETGRSALGTFELRDNNAAATRLTINSLGNVGIGTANPQVSLEVNGDFNLGSDLVGATNVYGRKLNFLGASFNTDPLWIARYNVSPNSTELRVNFGDDVAGDDKLVFGSTFNIDGIWYPRMTLVNNGRIGIGTANPTEIMHVVGNLRVQGSTDCIIGNGAGGTNCSSDIRLKNNIHRIKNPIEKLVLLRGVEFDWNEKSRSSGTHSIGVVAQDVERVFPSAVVVDEKTGYKSVDYAVLVAPIIESIKSLNEKINSHFLISNDQTAEVAHLKEEIRIIKEQLLKNANCNENKVDRGF